MFAQKLNAYVARRRVAQRGMTLLEIMIVLAILALVMGLVVGPKVMKMFGESKVHIAEDTVKKYAYEAYPSWSQAHPDKACPAQLSDLNEYMNNKDTLDPWHNEYRLYCGANLPAGAKGLAVKSLGENGKEDGPPPQGDDLQSW